MVTSKAWYAKNREFFESEKKIVKDEFPTLLYDVIGGQVFLTGKIYLDDKIDDIKIQDIFEIQIEFPDDYPKRLPKVREIGGKKEQILVRHKITDMIDLHFIKSDRGSACLCHPLLEKEYFNEQNLNNIRYFLNNLVLPFFYSLSFFDNTDRRPSWGEYSHGFQGTIEALSEATGFTEEKKILAFLKVIHKKKIGSQVCPCGSSRIITKCHPFLLEEANRLRKYPKRLINDVTDYIENNKGEVKESTKQG